MNLAVADLFTLNIYGLQGSLVTSLAHGLSSSGLFCSVGFIQDRTDNRNLFTLAFINSFNMYPVFSTSLFLLILGTTSFPGTLNFIGELFNMISLSIVDVVFNGLFVTSIPLTTSYSLFLFKRSCGNIYLNYRNQTMDVSRLYLWIPSAALFPLTDQQQLIWLDYSRSTMLTKYQYSVITKLNTNDESGSYHIVQL